jgi:hypothetical protein
MLRLVLRWRSECLDADRPPIRRASRVRVLDLRTKALEEVAARRVRLEELSRTIPAALQSRVNVASATGRGGALEMFRGETVTDTATIASLREQLDAIESKPFLATYRNLEKKTRRGACGARPRRRAARQVPSCSGR